MTFSSWKYIKNIIIFTTPLCYATKPISVYHNFCQDTGK